MRLLLARVPSQKVRRRAGLQLGPELAIAFAATRGLKPVLLPVKVAAAALTARMVPVLGRFQLTGVVTALSQWRQAASQRVADMLGKLRPVILDPTSANSKQPSALSKSVRSQRRCLVGRTLSDQCPCRPLTGVRRVIDKYGVAYMIGSRVVGVAAMAGLYVALTSGLDVSGMIEAQGWKSAGNVSRVLSCCVLFTVLVCALVVGDVAGDWAAAFMVSGLLFPAGLYCAPFLAKGLSRWKSVLLKQ
jgi:hypothetical protein